jgi:hypothetical protein
MEALPSLALGPPLGFHSSLASRELVTLLMYHWPLEIGVRLFKTFHVSIMEFYFPNMTWFDIRNIVKLIRFYFQMVFLGSSISYVAPNPTTVGAWILTLNPLNISIWPFFNHVYTHASFSFFGERCNLCLAFFLTTSHVIPLMWQPGTYFYCPLSGVFFFPFVNV